jgi:predicted transcriptional regulator
LLEIDLVANALKNSEWHELDKIFEKCKLSEVKVKKILKFLEEYDFIEINGQKIRVSTSLQRFLEETQL